MSGNEAENQLLFVAFVLPSSKISLQFTTHHRGFLPNKPTRQMLQKQYKFWPQPPFCCLDIYITLYVMCLKLKLTRGPHETQSKVSRATLKKMKKKTLNFEAKLSK